MSVTCLQCCWHCCLAWKYLTKRKQWRVNGKEILLHLFHLEKFWISINSPSQKCWPKENDMKSVITGSESKRSITGHWFTMCLTSRGAFLCTKLEKQQLTAMGKWMLQISRYWCLKVLYRTTVCVSHVDGSCCLWLKQEENLPSRYWVASKKIVFLERWGSKWCKLQLSLLWNCLKLTDQRIKFSGLSHFLQWHGHEVICLPLCMWEFSAIELTWYKWNSWEQCSWWVFLENLAVLMTRLERILWACWETRGRAVEKVLHHGGNCQHIHP